LFEIAIKQKIGKLPDFSASIQNICNQAIDNGFTFLNIQNSHIQTYNSIPLFEQHRDPFDRLLIATAIEEKAIVISDDNKFNLYNNLIEVLW
jgi:PIN domain nuclease of toxin-antitoxin system